MGRVLPNGHVAIDLAAVAPNPIDNDEPRYCPAPVKDRHGQGPGSIARDYENQVKRYVNPDAPTPDGMAVALANPLKLGAVVKFDDCQHSTGTLVEAKGPTFLGFLRRAQKADFDDLVDKELVEQATKQVAAAGPREVRWFFADKELADHVDELFREHGKGLERIEIQVLPYLGRRK